MDFAQIQSQFNNSINKIATYFKTLPKDEMYSWIAVGAGLILVIISLFLL